MIKGDICQSGIDETFSSLPSACKKSTGEKIRKEKKTGFDSK